MTLIAVLPYGASSNSEKLDGLVIASDRAEIDPTRGHIDRTQKIYCLFNKKIAFGVTSSAYYCRDETVVDWKDGFVHALEKQPFDPVRLDDILKTGLDYHFGLYIDQLKHRGVVIADMIPTQVGFWYAHHHQLYEIMFTLNPQNPKDIQFDKKFFQATGSITAFGNDKVADVVSNGPGSKYWKEFQLADKDGCMQKFIELYINGEIGLEDQMESLRNLSKAAYYFCNAQYKEMKRPTNRPGPQDFIMLQYVGRTVDIIVVDANGCYFDA